MPIFRDPSTKWVDLFLLGLFACSLTCSIVATNSTSWLVLNPANEYMPGTKFGLFQSCTIFGDSTSCSPFPSRSLCEDRKDFCALWLGARFGQIAADCTGLLAVVGFILALGTESSMKTSSARVAVAGIAFHFVGQLAAMILMMTVQNDNADAPLPIFKTSFGYSFILCIVAWVLDVFLAAIKGVSIFVSRRTSYEEISS